MNKPMKQQPLWKVVRGQQYLLTLIDFWKGVRELGFQPENCTPDVIAPTHLMRKPMKGKWDVRERAARVPRVMN